MLREGYIDGLRRAERMINEQLSFSIGEQMNGLHREPHDKVLQYRVDAIKAELDKLVSGYQEGGFYNPDMGYSWQTIQQALEDMRQIINKKFGRGSIRK